MSRLKNTRAHALVAICSAVVVTLAVTAFMYAHKSRVLAAEQDNRPAQPAKLPAQQPSASPVLVEIFTSEGCSDCPPADALLAHLQQDQPIASANVIALEEHVDYWDHLGWRDRFSSHDLTLRQNEYTSRLRLDDNYTPQMIVDGAEQFVGSDSAKALRAVAAAARTPKLRLVLSPLEVHGSQLSAAVSVEAGPAPLPGSDLYAALVQRTATTRVASGENGGRSLTHVSTVLSLVKIGDARKAATPLPFSFKIPAGVDPANLDAVVFIQKTGQGEVQGAIASAPLVRP